MGIKDCFRRRKITISKEHLFFPCEMDKCKNFRRFRIKARLYNDGSNATSITTLASPHEKPQEARSIFNVMASMLACFCCIHFKKIDVNEIIDIENIKV